MAPCVRCSGTAGLQADLEVSCHDGLAVSDGVNASTEGDRRDLVGERGLLGVDLHSIELWTIR
jgi:hypothetical protein